MWISLVSPWTPLELPPAPSMEIREGKQGDKNMTSLKESVIRQFQNWTSNLEPTWEKWADDYIKELEEYVRSEQHYADVEVVISNMLRFLRGEETKTL